MSAPQPPHIPDYEMLRRIGRGSYGEVWLAKSATGAFRAVKVVYRESFDHERPYEREFGGIKQFEPISRGHSTQVDILHVGRNDAAGYFYYVMELADDQNSGPHIDPDTYSPRTLRSDLYQHKRLKFQECLDISLHLAAALEHLHKHGLVHRDIKPSNIIFINNVPRLADIGLVTASDVARSFVGTEGYVPMEGPGTVQADLYGLGKVLYEISTGRDRLDFPELPTNLRALEDKEAWVQFNEVVLRACDEDRAQRYQSATQLIADLQKLKAGQPLITPARELVTKTLLIKILIGVVFACGLFWGIKNFRFTQPASVTSDRPLEKMPVAPALKNSRLVPTTNVLYQTRFEAPAFRLGQISGQDGWFANGGWSKNSAQIVASEKGQRLIISGPKIEAISPDHYNVTLIRPVPFNPARSGMPRLSVSYDCQFNPGARTNTAKFIWALLMAVDTKGTTLASIGVDKLGAVFGQVHDHVVSAKDNGANALHNLRFDLDFAHNQATFFLNGTPFGMTVINPYASTNLGSLHLVLQSSEPLDSTLFVDRISITATASQLIGPVARWTGDGNVLDSIGTNTGKLHNGATYAPGLVDQAFSLDGVDDYIEIQNSTELNFDSRSPMSVELWAYRTGPLRVMHLLGKRIGCSSANYQLAFDSFGVRFDGAGTAITGWQLPLETWVHMAATFDGRTLRLYTNGQLAAFSPGSLGPTNNVPLRIGASGACGANFAGLLDEISIYRRVLSDSEIHSICAASSALAQSTTRTETPSVSPRSSTKPQLPEHSGEFVFTTLAMASAGGQPLNYPEGIAADNAGNVYFADTANHTVCKVDMAGNLSVFAGKVGQRGSADGAGSMAEFNSPSGIAVTRWGTVYVADRLNHIIRKITPAGEVTTFAGLAGTSGAADGTGSSARFNSPSGLGVDWDGTVYVADRKNHAIRRITSDGLVSTLAGLAGNPGDTDGHGNVARFRFPFDVAVDGARNVYVADTGNHIIRRITQQRQVSTIGGVSGVSDTADGTRDTARFKAPIALASDNFGNIFVAEQDEHTIRKLTPSGRVTTIAGSMGMAGFANGTMQEVRFNKISGIAVDAMGSLFVSDAGNKNIRCARIDDEPWRYDWHYVKIGYEPDLALPGHHPMGWIPGEMAPDKYQSFPFYEGPGKRKGFIAVHPLAERPCQLKFGGIVPSGLPVLTVEASGHVFGDSLLQCMVNGKKIGEYVIVGYQWTTCQFDLSPHLGKPIEIELWNSPGGKHKAYYEHCYIDSIRFTKE